MPPRSVRHEPPEREEPKYIRYGGKVTAVDWILWPSLGVVPLFGLIPDLPVAWGWVFVCLGVLFAISLGLIAATGAFDSDSWVEGGRYQLTLMLVGFVLGTINSFAVVYALLYRLDRGAFSQSVEGTAAFYFSACVWASGGLGDIVPVSSVARMITVGELYVGLITVLVVLGTAVSKAFGRRPKFILTDESDEGGQRTFRFMRTESPDSD